MYYSKKILVSLFAFLCSVCMAQQQLDLARAYLQKGDVEKAYTIFQDLESSENIENYYEEYRFTLLTLHKEKELMKLYKQLPEYDYKYRIDKALLTKEWKDENQGNKELITVFREAKTNEFDSEKVLGLLNKRELNEEIILFITEYRNMNNHHSAFSNEMAQAYFKQGNKKKMIDEYVTFAVGKPEMLDYVEGQLQQKLSSKEGNLLEDVIYDKMGHHSNVVYNELLAWHYIQQREFNKAFLEMKAIDNLKKQMGEGLMEFGDMVFKNRKYDVAERVYEYISTKYPLAYISYTAKTKMIKASEQIIKSEYPIDTDKVQRLISDYELLYKTSRRLTDQVDAQRSIAAYKAYYMKDMEGARMILEGLTKNQRIGAKQMAQCKLDLADIYVFEENEWEAILLYGQVVKEADRVDVDLAHEAKLKTARVYYFMSDFDLAKEYLEILKLATTREIANDAIDLAVLIQDNLGLDTSNYALGKYANAEKLRYQQKYTASLAELTILEDAIGAAHGMMDEVYWLRAKIYRDINDLENAKKNYLKIVDKPKDIYTDDALYELALIEEDLGNISSAMDYYKKLMIDFPGSIYVAEARKKFRALRGDY